MKMLVIAAVVAASLSGCATGYKPSGATGGFTERALAPDTYYVKFNGNAFTDEQRVVDFMMLRCAELALENGYSHFVILGSGNETSVSYYKAPTTTNTTANATANVYGNTAYLNGRATSTTTGGQIYPIVKPGIGSTVRFLRNDDGQAFDAARIRANTRAKYKLD